MPQLTTAPKTNRITASDIPDPAATLHLLARTEYRNV
ncbi:MAG: hypothetical protein JWR32_1751 [Mycobacterium sp.]|jgi:hypothetical protein|nr:hypothetical protein [Mycobacterium sp.]